MKESSIFRLALKEPKEPSVPRNIIRSEQSFERAGTLKLTKGDERKEKAMNIARKKLEIMNFEDRLLGKAKDKARMKRLDKKNKRGIYGN
jgi:hypothetical protein